MLEPASGEQDAVASIFAKAFNERLASFQKSHYITYRYIGRRFGELKPTARATMRDDKARLTQFAHNLDEVIA